MNRIVFGIYGVPDNAAGELQTLRELTVSWSRYGYQGEILEAETLDQLLQKATYHEAAFCFIQRAGHVIDEQWYPPCWNREGFHEALHDLVESTDFSLWGEQEQSGVPGDMKKDCLVVNLKRLKASGTSSFEEYARTAASNAGIGSLPEAMNAGRYDLAIGESTQFNQLLRKEPPSNIDELGLTSAQASFLKGVNNQTANAQKGVFLFNIESYQDLVESSGTVDAVFSVAAGFKANRILEVNGFDEETHVVFYDYSKRALEIRQQIVEQWDGLDFPAFVREIFASNPTPGTFYQLWSGTTPENINWDDVNWFWQYELEKWGGADAFKAHWDRYKTLNHQYLHCNLLADKQKLFNEVAKYKQPYLWWSNAFFTVYSNWFLGFDERRAIYEKWITALAASSPGCRVNGSDYNNTGVNGFTAKTYLQQYNSQPSDELHPVKLHEIEIRY